MTITEAESTALEVVSTVGLVVEAVHDLLLSPDSGYKKSEAQRLLQGLHQWIVSIGKVPTNPGIEGRTVFQCIRQMQVDCLHAYDNLIEREQIIMFNLDREVITLAKLLDLSLEE